MKQIKQHKSTDATWTDDKGITIPYSRITGTERLKEKLAFKIATDAQKLNKEISEFKKYVEKQCNDLYARILKENNAAEVKAGKGNFTWFNFDRSVKITVSISERIEFKSPEINIAKEKFDAFIGENLNGVDELVRQLVNDAFQNTKNGLDSKKVLSLLKYRGKIKAEKFQEALDLIEKSIERTSSKVYFQVWLRGENNEYESIDLNFSSI